MLYQLLQQDASLAEALGFHSLWLAEHHFWYDGWCPAPVAAAAAVLGAPAGFTPAPGFICSRSGSLTLRGGGGDAGGFGGRALGACGGAWVPG